MRGRAVLGTVLVPGAGLLELGFAAARAVGATTVSAADIDNAAAGAAGRRALRVQVQVDAPEEGEGGRRALSIYGPPEEAPDGTAWTLHAQGVLSRAEARAAMPEEVGLEAWPPVGGTPIDLTGLYSTLQAHGYGYGPSFQGLREAWRVGDVVYGGAVLPEALSESAQAYGGSCASRCGAARLGACGRRGARVHAVRCCCRLNGRRCRCLRPARGSCVCVRRWSVVARAKPWPSCSWPMAAGGGGGSAGAAEGSERSANPRGGAERGAAPVPLDWRAVALSEAGPEASP